MKNKSSTGVICDKCGHYFAGHSNLFGKICIHCGNFIKPISNSEDDIFNKKSYIKAQEEIRKYLKEYIKEQSNANQRQ